MCIRDRSKTYFSVVSNRSRNTESLKSFSDSCSSVSSSLAACLDCDCSTYCVSPCSILKADRLNFLNLVIYIKTSVFCDFLSFFDRADSIAI